MTSGGLEEASAAMRKEIFDSWFPTVAAVLLGFVLGRMWGGSDRLGATVSYGNLAVNPRHANGMITAAGDDDGGKVRKRPRPFRDGEIGLSPKQWRMLQDKPSLLEIDFGQCVAWKGIREIPIEDVNGFGPLGMTIKESDEGPDLSSIAEFFGLDEPRTSSGEVRVPENFREIERLG